MEGKREPYLSPRVPYILSLLLRTSLPPFLLPSSYLSWGESGSVLGLTLDLVRLPYLTITRNGCPSVDPQFPVNGSRTPQTVCMELHSSGVCGRL